MNLNFPGYGTSGGLPSVFTDHQAKSYYEAIEWVACQPWCTGKVGLSGVSYHAIAQYHVAACQHYGGPPPALKCICPWEGFSDVYREVACPGGLDDPDDDLDEDDDDDFDEDGGEEDEDEDEGEEEETWQV